MSVSKADNAMMAKIHCIYGKRIKAEDYERLIQKRTVAEIAGFLKDGTYYSDALAEVKEDLIHRELLESLLFRSIWDSFLRLIKYSYQDKQFLKMHIKKHEIEEILLAIRLINAGEMREYIKSLPVYLAKHMSVDLFAVAKVTDYDGLLETLKKTEYYQLLGRFRPVTAGKPVDITECETALLTHYYAKMLELIRKNYSGDIRDDLTQFINYQIDFHNVTVIYRMKRYFRENQQEISNRLVNIRAKLSKQIYDDMLGSHDFSAITGIMGSQHMAKNHKIDADTSAEELFFAIQRIRHSLAQRVLRFSTAPVVVMHCFVSLLEIEVNNITNIIEGIRYNLSADEIRAMLVI